jgi:peptide/nickel transport system substrate-binding protein
VNFSRTLWRTVGALTALALVALLVSACGSSGGSSGSGTTPSGGTASVNIKQTGVGLTQPTTGSGSRIKGGTVTYAEAPGAPPNYIFPMYSPQYCDVNNIGQLNQMLYRPLYWYGDNYSPTIDYGASIGKKPQFSNGNKTITIHLNHYMWSDGEQVSARDLVFWINVMKADPAKEWCNYAPGRFPDNVASYKALNTTTFQMTLNGSYNPTWVIYNELSQLTPMPIAWDRTSLSQPVPSPTAANLPDTTKAGAGAVYDFLNTQGQKIATWGGSPLWSVVDGPWKVQSTTTNGGVTFVPNSTYSGSPKAALSKFIEVPFTSESALVNQIKSQGTSSLNVAYIPSQYQPLTSSFEKEGYGVNMASSYETDFMVINHNAPKVGVIFQQLYARQALQHLIDQTGWISHFLHGTATPTYGPAPLAPPSPLVSHDVESNAYPFSVAAATELLKDNGWKVMPGGQSTCQKPGTGAGECGAGVKPGQPFAFTVNYESDVSSVSEEMEDFQSQASKVGIKILLETHPFDDVAEQTEHCAAGTPTCDWDADNYGAGWLYGPSYYPTGETLFASTSNANFSNNADPKMDKLIDNTLYAKPSAERAAMAAFVKYASEQVPYLWTPDSIGAYGTPTAGTLVDKKIGGFTANAFGALTPEDWFLTK